MLALVLAVLAQVPDVRVTRVERVEYGRAEGGRSNVRGLAFFEFAPASGAGMGVAGAAPNWLLQSEDFTTTWTGNAGVVAAPTVTANYEGVADRVQIPATTPPTQYSRLLQGVSVGWPGGPMTCSVQVKGTSGSGSIPIYVLTGFPNNKAICAFNATSYTTCSVSWTSIGSGGDNFYIGPSGVFADGSFPAIDVLLRNAQCNPGSIVTPYIKTTTAAAGYLPTGAKGEALTFTRTGTAFATKTTSGGLATTGIANGDLVLMPGDTPRVEYDSQGVLGLRVESARTNSALRSQEVSDAIWVKAAAGTGAIPTVTADFATAPDGTTTADRVQFSSCATVGSYSAFSANITTTSPTTSSVYMRAASGTPTVSVCPFNFGTSLGTCSQVTLSTSSWTRFDVPNFAWTTNFNLEIGCENRTASYTGATNSGAADVLVWGIQAEAGAYATSYIPTTTAAATRNAERAVVTLPSAVSTTTGSHAASVTTLWSNNNGPLGYIITYGANASPLYGVNDLRSYDSTTQVILATTWTAGASKRVWSSYTGSTQSVDNGSTSTTGLFDGSMPTTTSLEFGSQGAGNIFDAIYSRLCGDSSPARCR